MPEQNSSYSRTAFFLKGVITLLLSGALFMMMGEAHAHPEDEICGPDSGINPELCRQLSEMNSSEAELTHPLVDEEGNALSPLNAAWMFLKTGVQHILPGGTDHILFVLALFLAAKTMPSLILQISVFTVAHTATLGLTAAGIIEPPEAIVEPLIALSIAIVAIENVFMKESSRWRHLIIFGFGLFHGMGFAGFIREVGLPPEQFWPSLIGFNVGVEIGQLSVVALALAISIPVKGALARTPYTYRNTVTVPFSLLIAVIGVWWFVTRSFGL